VTFAYFVTLLFDAAARTQAEKTSTEFEMSRTVSEMNAIARDTLKDRREVSQFKESTVDTQFTNSQLTSAKILDSGNDEAQTREDIEKETVEEWTEEDSSGFIDTRFGTSQFTDSTEGVDTQFTEAQLTSAELSHSGRDEVQSRVDVEKKTVEEWTQDDSSGFVDRRFGKRGTCLLVYVCSCKI